LVLRSVLGRQNEGTQVIHTDEDDEFARIERENAMKGQPYHWEAEAIKAAVRMEREACAKVCDEFLPLGNKCAYAIRARGQA